jgi:uncharacterized protein YcbK (DUF882 family)
VRRVPGSRLSTRWRRLAAGGLLLALSATTTAPALRAAIGETRTLSFFNIHTKETTTVVYKRDGKWVAGAKDQLDWALRDWRRNEKTAMDAELYDLLFEMHQELGSKEPIHLISAYRSRGTNEMLRNTVGGQASESRHILGKAADVHFPDIDVKQLRYSALVRERGGVGYYPTSALPFVHVDTDRVRAWPRLPRHELALLFPDGRTQHQPADGGPITPEDARQARVRHTEVATQVAAFHDLRRGFKAATAVAEANKGPPAAGRTQVAQAVPPPQLREPPRVVDRSSRLSGPSTDDRQQMSALMQLASLVLPPQLLAPPQAARRPAAGPQVAAINPREAAADVRSDAAPAPVFVPAPAFDDEHPEELSYRPFPIAPLLTRTASADDPALLTMTAPDVTETLKLLDQSSGMPGMLLRPNRQQAALLWSQAFRGEAVEPRPAPAAERQSALAERRVATGAK